MNSSGSFLICARLNWASQVKGCPVSYATEDGLVDLKGGRDDTEDGDRPGVDNGEEEKEERNGDSSAGEQTRGLSSCGMCSGKRSSLGLVSSKSSEES